MVVSKSTPQWIDHIEAHSQFRPLEREIATSAEGLFKSVFQYGSVKIARTSGPVIRALKSLSPVLSMGIKGKESVMLLNR